jgi:phage anti-repressor protein
MNNIPFYKLLLNYTSIDRDFIKDFFKKFQIDGELNFDIKDSKVAKYLDIDIDTLRNRLNNKYSKYINYIKNVDFIKVKSKKYKTSKTYMLNYNCFERIAMNSDSKKSESIRMYFVKIR